MESWGLIFQTKTHVQFPIQAVEILQINRCSSQQQANAVKNAEGVGFRVFVQPTYFSRDRSMVGRVSKGLLVGV